jgi:hypothetical protein
MLRCPYAVAVGDILFLRHRRTKTTTAADERVSRLCGTFFETQARRCDAVSGEFVWRQRYKNDLEWNRCLRRLGVSYLAIPPTSYRINEDDCKRPSS